MKKALTLSIGGRMFQVEDDAYTLLETYLTDLRKKYASDHSVDELIDDIEASISEKLEALHRSCITRRDVESIIQVMGKVDEIEPEAPMPEVATSASDTHETGTKRLYRNSEEKMLAGVCSGIAAYLGVDVVFVRFAFVLLTLINGIGIVTYLVCWVIMPEAKTTSQKLAMQGKRATINELQEALKQKTSQMAKEGKEAVERFTKDTPEQKS